jgi:hypothetical protein
MTKARDLSNIISGGFTADDIPSLDTAKITTDEIAKITTGSRFDASSKIGSQVLLLTQE